MCIIDKLLDLSINGTKSQRKISNYLLYEFIDYCNLNSQYLATKLNVSPATLSRFLNEFTDTSYNDIANELYRFNHLANRSSKKQLLHSQFDPLFIERIKNIDLTNFDNVYFLLDYPFITDFNSIINSFSNKNHKILFLNEYKTYNYSACTIVIILTNNKVDISSVITFFNNLKQTVYLISFNYQIILKNRPYYFINNQYDFVINPIQRHINIISLFDFLLAS